MRWVLLLGLAACGRISIERIDSVDADEGDAQPDTIKYVQTVSTKSGTGSMFSTVTFPTKPTPGNLIVVTATCFEFNGQSSLESDSTMDSGSGLIPLVVHEVTPNNCLNRGTSVAIYAGIATAESSGVVTVTPQPSHTNETSIMAAEYSGVSLLDDSASFVTAVATSSPHASKSGVANAVAVPTLAVAVGTDCSGDPNPQVWTDTAGFDIGHVQEDLTTFVPGIYTRKIVTTPGPVEDTWSVEYTGPTGTAYGAIATFR